MIRNNLIKRVEKKQSPRKHETSIPLLKRKNVVKNRLFPLSPTVLSGQEGEYTTKDFESLSRKAIGVGAFASVYLVRHKTTKLQYAIKAIKKTLIKEHGLLEDIQREIEIMYALENEHIIKLHNHFEDDYKVYLLLEYASGGTLYDEFSKCFRKKSRIPELSAAQYLKEIIEAMKCMDAANVIHRDIKPENVLLDSEGKVKLADFGFACYDTGNEASEKLCGTPIYCAPEMIKGSIQHTALDRWSLGVLLFEMLTG